ncbi:alkene reductase [Halovulum sp. GXIMD14794]
MTDKLFTPASAGALDLSNRIVMAPLTRNRADDVTGEVGDLHVEYYAQRASAGLIITEATQISPEGKGYIQTPGIHTEAQADAWKRVTDAVHAKGGKIVVQLWHVGRISHNSLQPNGQAPVAPSAIKASAQVFTHNGFEPTSEPRALELSEIPRLIEDYRNAVRLAKRAGFDGVEIHAANNYLLEQFLKSGTNQRTDAYGGSPENRARLLLEVIEAAAEEWSGDRIGVRLSPFRVVMTPDDNPMETYSYLIPRLGRYNLAYLHMIEGQAVDDPSLPDGQSHEVLKALWNGVYMVNNAYDAQRARDVVDSGKADLVSFGRPFISNPDLVTRLEKNAELALPDRDTMYGGGAEGYTDYPKLDGSRAAA